MDFVAIDVETANPNMASICQVGIASYECGQVAREWCTYVDPEDWFDPFNVLIHGIDEDTVAGAPALPGIVVPLLNQLYGNVVVCHTHFDRVSLNRAFAAYGLELPALTWLDTARVARRAWEQCRHRGYGLFDVCSMLGYQYQAHDALADAKAAGHVLLAAMAVSGLSIEEWLWRVEQRMDGEPRDRFAQQGNPDGPLQGEVICFTGALLIPRREAAARAAEAGCQVVDNVTKKTTLLVMGDQDVRQLAEGQTKSSKHRKAEELIAAGHTLRILRETDFMQLVRPGD